MVKQDIATRFNYVKIMTETVIKCKDAIRHVIVADENYKRDYYSLLLSSNEVGIGEDLVELLDPFLKLTEVLSGSEYVTCSVILPGVSFLIKQLRNFQSKNMNMFMHSLAESMADDLEERAKPYFANQLLIASTFLDPRYKKFKFVSCPEKRDAMFFKAKNYIKLIHRK
jgi:hypothetical protein